MKFLSYRHDGARGLGVEKEDGRTADLTQACGFGDLAAALRELGPQRLLEMARAESLPIVASDADITYRPAVADTNRIFCVGLNYEEHRVEAGRARTEHPTIFLRLASSQTGHEQAIVVPRELPEGLDFEGEIAVVIGRRGRRIAKEEAWRHVFGLSAYNDASARRWQAHSTQWTAGKNFPDTGAFGPVVVAMESFDNDAVWSLTTRLNGEIVQQADTSMMIFSIPELVAYISTFTELMPGDVIVSGTPGGVGFKRTPPLLMQPGDVVEVEVGGVGVLRNSIVSEAAETL